MYSQVAQWKFTYKDVQQRIKRLRSGGNQPPANPQQVPAGDVSATATGAETFAGISPCLFPSSDILFRLSPGGGRPTGRSAGGADASSRRPEPRRREARAALSPRRFPGD
jgi:hypothetical protein